MTAVPRVEGESACVATEEKLYSSRFAPAVGSTELGTIEVKSAMCETGSSLTATEPSGDDPGPCRNGAAERRGPSLTAGGAMA